MRRQGNGLFVLGIGFGPANMAVAIAHSERTKAEERRFVMTFVDRHETAVWHPGMQHGHGWIQISFLKDLVTLRNPRSRFTFINYLFSAGRLVDVANMRDYRVSREEYEDYLKWCARQLSRLVTYGREVVEITPQEGPDGLVQSLGVTIRDTVSQRVRRKRVHGLCVGIGRTPRLPSGVRTQTPRIVHSSHFTSALRERYQDPSAQWRFAIIGGGQSAAEICYSLLHRYPHAEIAVWARRFVFRSVDESPFANNLYTDGAALDYFDTHQYDPNGRDDETDSTNVGCAEGTLLSAIAQLLYAERVRGSSRAALNGGWTLLKVRDRGDDVELTVQRRADGSVRTERYDAVFLATGFDDSAVNHLLRHITPFLDSSRGGSLTVDKNHVLRHKPNLICPIVLHGGIHQHGHTDGTITNLAWRSDRIASALAGALAHPNRLSHGANDHGERIVSDPCSA